MPLTSARIGAIPNLTKAFLSTKAAQQLATRPLSILTAATKSADVVRAATGYAPAATPTTSIAPAWAADVVRGASVGMTDPAARPMLAGAPSSHVYGMAAAAAALVAFGAWRRGWV